MIVSRSLSRHSILHSPQRVFSTGRSSDKGSSMREGWKRFVTWTTKPQPTHPSFTLPWFKDKFIICSVFAVTGSSSMYFVRPFLPKIGLEGSFKEGPWSYRIGSLLLVSPMYTLILLLTGSLAGRHNYFAAMARKMWGRFLPAPLAKKVGCAPAKLKEAAAAKSNKK
mmetsp:Transcript_4452/g.6767  ORF Transcript_4452/g.6767 Transcript_4452/m.6767 type:complete len:167 (+) Transcript_4452:73-573(+)